MENIVIIYKAVTVFNWSIITDMGAGHDILVPYGEFENHPSVHHGIPSTFLSFDRDTLTAHSISGRKYKFDAGSFNPNGNAKSLDEALTFIENNWVKK